MLLAAISISAQQLYGQLLIGLINGSFYALLSLGLAVIFGMLNVVNFAHGAFYILVALIGAAAEPLFIRRFAGLDPLYGLLLTFGLALVVQGLFQNEFGSSGKP